MRKDVLAVSLLATLTAWPAAARLLHGDLVVTDRVGQRLWQIRPAIGTAEVFSPASVDTNLFDSPTDVATTSGRGVYVADGHQIIAVDPDTGAQHFLTTLIFAPGGPIFVPIVFDGLIAGIDADANGTLWVVESRTALPGRLWKVTYGTFTWTRELVHETEDLARIGNGLAVTSDDDGDANDVFFTTANAAMLNVDVGTGLANELEPPVPPILGNSFGGNIDALGDCEDLLCSVLFTRAVWAAGFDYCVISQVYAYVLVAIIGGIEPLDDVSLCASAIAARSASDAYLLMVDFRDLGTRATTRVLRFHSQDDEWVDEHVAWLPGYETYSRFDAYSGMDVVTVPEPGAAAGAFVACAVLGRRWRRLSPPTPR